MLVAGPSCTSRSPLNPNSADNKGCVKAKQGTTGATFAFSMDYIRTRRPSLVILENVVELSEGADSSDAAFIEQQLRGAGYEVQTLPINAMDFGARCRRIRLYWVALRKRRGDCAASRAQGEVLRTLESMKTTMATPIPWSKFFLPHELYPDVLPPRSMQRQRKAPRTEQKCDDEHMDLFHEFGLPWPPPTSELDNWFKGGSAHDLPQRSKEVVYLCHKLFEGDDAFKPGVPEFLDANVSIGRMRLKEGHNPWARDVVPTLVGSMKLVIRTKGQDGDITIRCVSGVESLQLQGWDLSYFAKPDIAVDMFKNETMVSLAGNAFNAFACGPVFAASVPMIDGALPLETDLIDELTEAKPSSDIDMEEDHDSDDSKDSDGD